MTGHNRKRIYAALREIQDTPLPGRDMFHRRGKTRFTGYNIPGPVVYEIATLDSTLEVHLRKASAPKRRTWGDVERFVKPGVHNLETPETMPGVHNLGTQKGISERVTPKGIFERTPPKSPPGGTCSSSGGPSAERARDNGSGNGNGKRATKAAERMREAVRLFLEREATIGDGLKSLDHWRKYFPKGTYDAGMVAEVFREVETAQGDRRRAERGEAGV